MNRLLATGLTVVCLLLAGVSRAAETGIKLISTPGDPIGQGLTQTYTAPAASISAASTAGQVRLLVSEGSAWWSLEFAAPKGTPLAPGSHPNAARYPFNSPLGAGLSVYRAGTGCNTIKGWFRVHEFELDASGVVTKLAIDFVQNCEVTLPPLYGAVRYNSARPLVVPDLVSVAGADFATYAGMVTRLDGSQSFSRRRPSRLAFRWTQVAGPAVALSNASAEMPTFVAPAVPLSGDSLQFRLEVSDGARRTSSDEVVVLVRDPSAARTELSFRGDPGDYISLGRSWNYDKANAVFDVTRNPFDGVSTYVTGDTWWQFDIAGPAALPLAIGTYANAQRYPFQGDGSPGLSLAGNGRGCNTLTGEFTVHQAAYDASGVPTLLEVEFEQHCDGAAPAAYGRLLLNAVPGSTLAQQILKERELLGRRR